MEARSAKPSHRRLAATELVMPPGTTPSGSRGEILSAALKLIADRGFGGTSVRDIAAVVGLNPATLYAHFPSKEHVLAEIIRIGHEEHFERLRRAVLAGGGTPTEQLTALVRAHVRLHADYPMLAVVANAELHSLTPEFAAAALELRRHSQQMFIDVIERGRALGDFDVVDPWLATSAIGGMGLRVAHWYTPAFERTPDQVADIYADFALRLVGARRARRGRTK